jgi:hypothetical protein
MKEQEKQPSELLQLMLINAYKRELTPEERERAGILTIKAPENKEVCWLCGRPTILDTNLCKNHVFYALASRK